MTRASLFDSEQVQEYVPVELELEEVVQEEQEEEEKPAEEEFDFPLFSFGAISLAPEKSTEVEEERGRSSGVMKVSLREESEERVVNERPSSYYYAEYSEQQRQRFALVAVSGDDIYQQMTIYSGEGGRVVDLAVYNSRIVEHSKRKRAGKNQRENRIESRARKAERKKLEEEIEKQKMARIIKKKFHKRGGKKNKKKNGDKSGDKTGAKKI